MLSLYASMPVEVANQFLPRDNGMANAFGAVTERHLFVCNRFQQVKRSNLEALGPAVGDFFTAGVAYLANNGHDIHIQEVGIITWRTINQGQVLIAMTDNMLNAAISLGISPDKALTSFSRNDEPHVLFRGRKLVAEFVEIIACILMPPEFLVRATTRPVEALATMTWVCSQVRDMANGRLSTEGRKPIDQRAYAFEAHFLLEAVRKNPGIVLDPSYQKVLLLFPHGLNSLPPSLRYKGITGKEFKSAQNN